MRKFNTTLSFINDHVKASGYTAGDIIETDGYTTTGDKGAARWRALGTTGTISQDPLTNDSPNLSDKSGNEFVLVGEGVIDLNQLGGTTQAYEDIADASGLVYSQGLDSTDGDAYTKKFDTLNDAVISLGVNDGNALNIAERTTGNGGGAMWDVVLSSTVTENTFNIVQCTGVGTLSLVLRGESETFFDDWGGVGDGATNNTAEFLNVHTQSAAGTTLKLPDGTFEMNVTNSKLQLEGQGSSTVLHTFADGGFALKLQPRAPNWDFYSISNLKVFGKLDWTDNGIEFDPANEVAGRWDMNNVHFEYNGIGVHKNQGNIGNWQYRCSYYYNFVAYKVAGQFSPFMHGGNDTFLGNHWEHSQVACYFINDTNTSGGQICFRDNIFESNEGSGIVVRNLSLGIPFVPMVIDTCWFEDNATDGGTKSQDGYVWNNADINIADAGIVIMNNSYVNSLELAGTTIVSNACRWDNNSGTATRVIDSNSALVIRDFWGHLTNNTSNLFVHNIAHAVPWGGNDMPMQLMAHRIVKTAQGYGFTTSEAFEDGTTYGWVGSVSRNSVNAVDGLIFDACTELTINAGETLISSDAGGVITGGRWNVVSFGHKLTVGDPADLSLQVWDGGDNRLICSVGKVGQWQTSVTLIDSVVRASTGNISLYVVGSTDTTQMRFCDFQIMAFSTKQEAINYIDSREYQL